MNDRPALPAPTPWYRTRWFWGVVFGLCLAWGLFFYFTTFPSAENFTELYKGILGAFGSTLFALIGFSIFGEVGETVFVILYGLLVLFLVYKTFSRKIVNIVYPIILLALFIFGTFNALQIIAGFN